VVEAYNKPSNNLIQGFGALVSRQIKDWYKSTTLFALSLVQPVIWIVLYGESFPKIALPGISSNYFSFLSIGMLSFVVLFASIFSGMAIVFDRQSGFLRKMFVSSVSRGNIIMSYVVSTVLKALVQVAILLIVAVLLGMQTADITTVGLIATFVAEALLAIGLSAFFTMIGILSADPNVQLAVMSFISLPLLFASNSLFPTSSMPLWLQWVAKANPLSYASDSARQALLGVSGMASLTFDFIFLAIFAVMFSVLSVMLSLKFLSK